MTPKWILKQLSDGLAMDNLIQNIFLSSDASEIMLAVCLLFKFLAN